MNEPNLQSVWQSQRIEEIDMNAVVAQRTSTFQRQLTWLKRREHGAALIVVVVFGLYMATAGNPILQAGCALAIVGTLFSAWQLERRVGPIGSQSQRLGQSCIAFHRDALARHRDTLRSVWKWSLLPLLPGLVVFRWGVADIDGHVNWWINGSIAAVFLVIYAANRHAARRLQREIDALPKAQ